MGGNPTSKLDVLGPKVDCMARPLADFRKVAKQTETDLVLALALQREIIRDALRISCRPHAPMVKGSQRRKVPPEGIKHYLSIVQTLPRVAKDSS